MTEVIGRDFVGDKAEVLVHSFSFNVKTEERRAEQGSGKYHLLQVEVQGEEEIKSSSG